MIAERCDYMDCGALHYPWQDTYKVHVDLKEFASKARKTVIADYWKNFLVAPGDVRGEHSMIVAKAVEPAESCNTVPFKVILAKFIPDDESFPGNVRRLREESEQIYLSGAPFV